MDTSADKTNLVTQVFEVRGMTCSSCANAIKDTLSYFKGFKEAQFNIVDNEAFITYDTVQTRPEEWVMRLKSQGYSLHHITKIWPTDTLEPINKLDDPISSIRPMHPGKYLIMSFFLALLILFAWFLRPISDLSYIPIDYSIIINTFGFSFILIGFVSNLPLANGFQQLINRKPGMDSLIFISSMVATIYSLLSIFNPVWMLQQDLHPMVMFDGPFLVLASVTVGRILEDNVKRKTGQALKNLISRQPTVANLVSGNTVKQISVLKLIEGDVVLVRPGELIPIDGTVITGTSEVDQQIINGEAMPELKTLGQEVWAGTLNLNGSLQVQVMTSKAGTTVIETAIKAIRIAQSTPSKSQGLADRVAARFIPFVLILSVAALGFWLVAGAMVQAGWFGWDLVATTAQARSLGIGSMITVLIVSCPCALGLATPIVMVKAIGTASQNGILVRKGDGLEALGNITDIVFDKTGTLTIGTPYVCESYISSQATSSDFWRILSLISEVNNHPLTKAIMSWAKLNGPNDQYKASEPSSDFVILNDINNPGNGMEVFMANYLRPAPAKDVEEHLKTLIRFPPEESNSSEESDLNPAHHFTVLVGNSTWLRAKGCLVPPGLERFSNKTNQSIDASEVWIAIDGKVMACFFLKDEVRPDAANIIRWAEEKHINVHLLSGDKESPVMSLAAQLGIPATNAKANQLPTDKSTYILQLQAQGKIVAMIGDGINDAPSLAVADVSIAVKAGTDIAQQAASITLLRPDLGAIETAFRLSKQLNARIRENLTWAFGYNILMIPMAAGLSVALFHFHNSHLWAGLSMALSSITVVLNSIRIKVGHQISKS